MYTVYCMYCILISEVHGHGLTSLHVSSKIKTYENSFYGLFGLIYENLHQQKFPAIRYVCVHVDCRRLQIIVKDGSCNWGMSSYYYVMLG